MITAMEMVLCCCISGLKRAASSALTEMKYVSWHHSSWDALRKALRLTSQKHTSFWASLLQYEEKQAVEVKVHVRTKKANSNIWNKLPEGNVTEVVEHFLPEAEQLCPNCVQKWKSLAKKSTRLWWLSLRNIKGNLTCATHMPARAIPKMVVTLPLLKHREQSRLSPAFCITWSYCAHNDTGGTCSSIWSKFALHTDVRTA